jgi:hypothetical protein
LTIELTPAQGAESLRSCSEITYLTSPENNSLRSRAPELHSTKDTLLTLNTCLRRITAALQCARPCIASPYLASLQQPLGYWYKGCASDAHYPINFVVKHPNLVSLSTRPALRRCKPANQSH